MPKNAPAIQIKAATPGDGTSPAENVQASWPTVAQSNVGSKVKTLLLTSVPVSLVCASLRRFAPEMVYMVVPPV